MSEWIEITPQELAAWGYEDGFAYATMGMQVTQLKPVLEKAGIQLGDFVFSTSHTRDITEKAKANAALGAPTGTEFLLQRVIDGKIYRRSITL